jgi:hypothetical protein
MRHRDPYAGKIGEARRNLEHKRANDILSQPACFFEAEPGDRHKI